MNIHFKDKELFEALWDSTLYSVRVGSHLYGLDTELSDTDILCIYYPHKLQMNSCFNNHHQLQYKDIEKNIDFIFVDIITFIRNLVSGDSTINFELINSKELLSEMEDNLLKSLYDIRKEFQTFTVIRAYLGLARGDLKSLSKEKTPHIKWKKQCHIVRGRCIAKDMLESGVVPLNFSHLKDRWKNLDFDYGYNSNGINDIRDKLKERLNKGEITRYLTVETQMKVDELVQKELEEFTEYQLQVNPMFLFYPLNENNNIQYD